MLGIFLQSTLDWAILCWLNWRTFLTPLPDYRVFKIFFSQPQERKDAWGGVEEKWTWWSNLSFFHLAVLCWLNWRDLLILTTLLTPLLRSSLSTRVQTINNFSRRIGLTLWQGQAKIYGHAVWSIKFLSLVCQHCSPHPWLLFI